MGLLELIGSLFKGSNTTLISNMAELERKKMMSGMSVPDKVKYKSDLAQMKRTISQSKEASIEEQAKHTNWEDEWVDRDNNDYDSSSSGEGRRRGEQSYDDSNEY